MLRYHEPLAGIGITALTTNKEEVVNAILNNLDQTDPLNKKLFATTPRSYPILSVQFETAKITSTVKQLLHLPENEAFNTLLDARDPQIAELKRLQRSRETAVRYIQRDHILEIHITRANRRGQYRFYPTVYQQGVTGKSQIGMTRGPIMVIISYLSL